MLLERINEETRLALFMTKLVKSSVRSSPSFAHHTARQGFALLDVNAALCLPGSYASFSSSSQSLYWRWPPSPSVNRFLENLPLIQRLKLTAMITLQENILGKMKLTIMRKKSLSLLLEMGTRVVPNH